MPTFQFEYENTPHEPELRRIKRLAEENHILTASGVNIKGHTVNGAVEDAPVTVDRVVKDILTYATEPVQNLLYGQQGPEPDMSTPHNHNRKCFGAKTI